MVPELSRSREVATTTSDIQTFDCTHLATTARRGFVRANGGARGSPPLLGGLVMATCGLARIGVHDRAFGVLLPEESLRI